MLLEVVRIFSDPYIDRNAKRIQECDECVGILLHGIKTGLPYKKKTYPEMVLCYTNN